MSTQLLKIGTYLFLGMGVVILNMFSKGSLLLAASNLRAPYGTSFSDISNQYFFCQNYSQIVNNNGTQSWKGFAMCVMIRRNKLPKMTPDDKQTTLTISNGTWNFSVMPAYGTSSTIAAQFAGECTGYTGENSRHTGLVILYLLY